MNKKTKILNYLKTNLLTLFIVLLNMYFTSINIMCKSFELYFFMLTYLSI